MSQFDGEIANITFETPLEQSGFGDSTMSELVAEICKLFGFSIQITEELLDFLTENGLLLLGTRESFLGDPVKAVEAKYRQSIHFLIAYQERQKPRQIRPENGVMLTQPEMRAAMLSVYEDALMSTRAMALELGITTAAGGDTPAAIAKRFGYKKFTFCKCCENFQEKLGLPPRAGQRDESARKNMSETRIGQLSK